MPLRGGGGAQTGQIVGVSVMGLQGTRKRKEALGVGVS